MNCNVQLPRVSYINLYLYLYLYAKHLHSSIKRISVEIVEIKIAKNSSVFGYLKQHLKHQKIVACNTTQHNRTSKGNYLPDIYGMALMFFQQFHNNGNMQRHSFTATHVCSVHSFLYAMQSN